MINCLIVDDSKIAREIISEFCKFTPQLNIVGSFGDALAARETMATSEIDIMYVDINMPGLSGTELVRTLRRRPQVIFTTAYSEFAVEAFELSACDYLLKPFSLDRFIVATDKALSNIAAIARSHPYEENFLLIKNEKAIHRVRVERILYLEASRNNTKVVTDEEALTSTMSLSYIEKRLPGSIFQRVHRSFIVNTSKVACLQNNKVLIGQNAIPIGENYKSQFAKFIGLDRI